MLNRRGILLCVLLPIVLSTEIVNAVCSQQDFCQRSLSGYRCHSSFCYPYKNGAYIAQCNLRGFWGLIDIPDCSSIPPSKLYFMNETVSVYVNTYISVQAFVDCIHCTFEVTPGYKLPNGLVLSSSGYVEGVLSEVLSNYPISITASNNVGSTSGVFYLSSLVFEPDPDLLPTPKSQFENIITDFLVILLPYQNVILIALTILLVFLLFLNFAIQLERKQLPVVYL